MLYYTGRARNDDPGDEHEADRGQRARIALAPEDLGCSVSCCRILSKSGFPLSAEFGNWNISLTQRRRLNGSIRPVLKHGPRAREYST